MSADIRERHTNEQKILTFSQCAIGCCFRMESSTIEYGRICVARPDEQGQLSAAQHNALGTLLN